MSERKAVSCHWLPPGDVCPALFPLFISPDSLTLIGNEQSSVKDPFPHFLNVPLPEAAEMVDFSPNCIGRWVLIYNNNKHHQIFTFRDLENYPKLGNKGKSMNFQYHTETLFQRPTQGPLYSLRKCTCVWLCYSRVVRSQTLWSYVFTCTFCPICTEEKSLGMVLLPCTALTNFASNLPIWY